jgi:hypothetical protein
MMALVWGGTLNSSAANLRTAVNGASSGTLNLHMQQHPNPVVKPQYPKMAQTQSSCELLSCRYVLTLYTEAWGLT